MAGPDAKKEYACPHCSNESVWWHIDTPRHGKNVCRSCEARATDSAGRRVHGSNVAMSGGFVALYQRESGSGGEAEECDEVTESNVCFIDGTPCYINERRFGGTYIAPMKLKLEQIREELDRTTDATLRTYTQQRLHKIEQASQRAAQLYAQHHPSKTSPPQ